MVNLIGIDTPLEKKDQNFLKMVLKYLPKTKTKIPVFDIS